MFLIAPVSENQRGLVLFNEDYCWGVSWKWLVLYNCMCTVCYNHTFWYDSI